MERIWYIKVNGAPEGPFAVSELKKDPRITPDTLVWREGFATWVTIRYVVELKEVFADEGNHPEPIEEPKLKVKIPESDEIALDWGIEPPYFFWLILLIVVLIYTLRGCTHVSSGVDFNHFHLGTSCPHSFLWIKSIIF